MKSGVRKQLDNLDKLNELLAQKVRIRVGIFGQDSTRTDSDDVDNAFIGSVHENGAPEVGIPQRSWLRMPLIKMKNKIFQEGMANALVLIAHDKWKMVWENMGLACLRQISAAFDTEGFGTWEPLKMETIRRKGSSWPLIDTQQLRKSPNYEVLLG